MGELIGLTPPGICSQEDWEHDFREIMCYAIFLSELAREKGYKFPYEWGNACYGAQFPTDWPACNATGFEKSSDSE